MTNDPILVKVVDFLLWLGTAIGGFGVFYFMGPDQNLKWSVISMLVMIFFLSFRDLFVAKLRRKISKRTEEA